MQSLVVTKYEFKIRTRNGAVVEGLCIHGQDQEDACRKLMQMYRGCEIIEVRGVKTNLAGRTNHAVSYEEVVEMIISS